MTTAQEIKMEYKQVVTTKNMIQMLRPCMNTGDFCSTLYQVFDLESAPGEYPVSYAFCIHGNTTDVYRPTKYNLHGGICDSLTALKPTFEQLGFVPVAFVDVNIQGPLNKFVDQETREYDMRKHLDFDLRLPALNFTEVAEQSSMFTKVYKFILRDTKTNKIKPMPYYIEVSEEDVLFDKIATDKNVRMRFIRALQKMRQK